MIIEYRIFDWIRSEKWMLKNSFSNALSIIIFNCILYIVDTFRPLYEKKKSLSTIYYGFLRNAKIRINTVSGRVRLTDFILHLFLLRII